MADRQLLRLRLSSYHYRRKGRGSLDDGNARLATPRLPRNVYPNQSRVQYKTSKEA